MYRGIEKGSGKKYAVKVMSREGVGKEKKAAIRREAALMDEICQRPHHNIVQFVEYFEDRKNFYIVMEL